jgi:hypothetical protein
MSDPHVPSPTPHDPSQQVPPTQHDAAPHDSAQHDAAQPSFAPPEAHPGAQAAVPQYAAPQYAAPAASDVPASGIPAYAAPAASDVPAYATPAPARRGLNGLGLASLIIGIVALLGAFIPLVNYVSGFLALVGLVLGIIGLVLKNRARGLAIAGTATSGVALVLSIVLAIAYSAAFVDAVNDSFATDISSEQIVTDGQAAGAEPADAADAALGSRQNPAPIGSTVTLTDTDGDAYEISFGTPNLNATEAVVAANMFNTVPEAGYQYALVPVTVTYIGTGTGTPWLDVEVEFVSAAGTTHSETDAMAVAPDPEFMDINELHPGGSGTGNVAIMIPTEDAELGTWAISGFFGEETFFLAAQ